MIRHQHFCASGFSHLVTRPEIYPVKQVEEPKTRLGQVVKEDDDRDFARLKSELEFLDFGREPETI